ncbi:DUF2339 domain-containing protein [Kordia sp. YSTF-M3]|uniref:DUF2339 domain-containing protein n=1 Tax=Kordia aestuariivivens TaxID=2759037 RepID=A0ABR7Q7K3_9FLAO|nr:DUF2339 domain-containing protein [Kordia aestuariivivens]MBC8754468.1 DUF2339 domain-containing protein [Kordia aestuariivivens]
MEKPNESIQELLIRLEVLSKKQDQFAEEINDLRFRIETLRASRWSAIAKESSEKEQPVKENSIKVPEVTAIAPQEVIKPEVFQPKVEVETPRHNFNNIPKSPPEKSDLEKFIGENLLNKIGIIITVIGVSIGVKYSIENELISPLMRIILGYLSGIALLGFGIKLKKKYENYSAVLVSGAIAIMYFITYAAHSFYGLIPQIPAFILMVIFTVFGVVTAIHYNRQVIAHIGLVGAYAVPFLLSSNSGNAAVLFSYMTIINIGILVISYKKYWKGLYGSSFGFTWLIYFSWYFSDYTTDRYFGLALLFLSIFFIIFYTIFLAYKVIKKEAYSGIDIVLLFLNTFFFYTLGYFILDRHDIGEQFLGLFTLINALLHCVVAVLLSRQKEIDKNLFYLIVGLAIAFITIAIPVELDGNWVTILWVFQAAILFWIGRTKNHAIYEKLSYPLMLLAFLSIIQDWSVLYVTQYDYYSETSITPILNTNFLGSILFIAAFAYITRLYFKKEYSSPLKLSETVTQMLSFVIPGIFLFSIYYAFRIEIESYWNQLHISSGTRNEGFGVATSVQNLSYNLLKFKTIWVINYTLLFLSVLSFVNIKKIKNELLGYISLGLNGVAIILFLTQGLYALSRLSDSYMREVIGKYEEVGLFAIGIRYVSYFFIILLLVICYRYIREKFIKRDLKIIFDCVLHFTILCILSSELIHWFSMASNAASDKLGLSILWGSYALFTIVLGIWKKKKYLRIGAMALFGITLVKLFLYDIAHLTTIAKTIVFVSLGVLLLIISFLYNKYKSKIFDEV